jgi:hypothetical protein
MVAESPLSDMEQDTQEQTSSTLVGRITRRSHFPHIILAQQTKLKGQSQQTYKVCADNSKHQKEKAARKIDSVLPEM